MQIGPTWSRSIIAATIGAFGVLFFALSTPWLAGIFPRYQPMALADPQPVGLILDGPGAIDFSSIMISSQQSDPTSIDVSTTIDSQADLLVTKTSNPQVAIAGTPITYTIAITNTGPSDAGQVTLTDTLPGDVSFISSDPSDPVCNYDNQEVTCNYLSIPASGNEQVLITVNVSPSASGTLTNQVSVASITPGSRDPFSLDTTVNRQADLQIHKTGDPNPVLSGGKLTYQLQVTNNGPSIATGVALTDTLPSQVSYLDSTVPGGGSCSSNANTFACSLGDLDSGSSLQLSLEVRVDPVFIGDLNNQANVTSSIQDQDPNPDNNAAALPTTVKAGSKLADPQWLSPVSDEGIYFVTNGTVPLAVNITGIEPIDLDEIVFYRWDAVNSRYVNIAVVDVDGAPPPYQATLDAGSLNFTWNEIRVRAIDKEENPSDYRYIWIYRFYTNYLPKVSR